MQRTGFHAESQHAFSVSPLSLIKQGKSSQRIDYKAWWVAEHVSRFLAGVRFSLGSSFSVRNTIRMVELAITDSVEGKAVLNRWQVDGNLGKGSFSTVFSGIFSTATDQLTKTAVAVKFPTSPESAVMLAHEAKMMKRLKMCHYVPEMIAFVDKPACLVMERVGSTLLDLYSSGKHMSVKTALFTAISTITALESIHDFGVVHCDVKPDNIALDLTGGKWFFLDLGLSIEFIHNRMHVPYAEGLAFKGTPYFASEAVLRGVRATRRDDLESLGYVLLFLLKGTLPWCNVRFATSQDTHSMLTARSLLTVRKLCEDAPTSMLTYLTYCKSLNFADAPDYCYLKRLFVTALEEEKMSIDWQYDWTSQILRGKKEHKREHCNNLRKNMHLLEMSGTEAGPGEKIEWLRRMSHEQRGFDDHFNETPVHPPHLDVSRLRKRRSRSQDSPLQSAPLGFACLPVEVTAAGLSQ